MRRKLANFLLAIADRLDGSRAQKIIEFYERCKRIEKRCELNLAACREQQETFRLSVAPDWSPDDIANLRKFLSTPSGQALTNRMHAYVATVCIAGCNTELNTTHAAGVGAGWDECVKKLMEHATLSRVASVEATNHETPPGEAELLERYSP